MDSIGVQLKNARMRKGLSIEEVGRATRIQVRLLQAIEDDDLESMDSIFFYRSFTKQFAHCVGVNDSALTELLDASSQRIPEPPFPGQHSGPARPQVAALKPKRAHKFKWLFSIFSLAIMLGACSTFYQFWESSRTLPASPGNSRFPEQQVQPGSAKASAPGIAKPGDPADSLRIKLSALENTWLSLTADGKPVFKGTLRADESKTLEGRLTAQVQTGNAGGVEIVFNGRPLGKLGPEGQNRTVVFTRDSYNVLHARLPMALAALIRNVE